jgi:hypothetical protein
MHKMPQEIEFVADKILKNKVLYDEIKNLLIAIIRKLNNDSMGHSSFCNALRTPNTLDKKLLKIFGISDRQMLSSFTQIGFHPDSRMYSSLYYQTLSLVYYIGVRADDDLLRTISIALIYVKVFNGRQYKFMPNGCQDEIAQFLIQSIFRKSHTFKKYPNPFVAITQYFAPTLDEKYFPYVQKDPAHPTLGLVVILMQAWGRMEQVFMGIQKHYYQAHADGNKSVIGATSDVKGTEVDSIESSKVASTVSKLQKNLMHRPQKISESDRRYLKADPYSISNKFLTDSEVFLNSDDAEDDLKNIYELMFNIIKIDDTKICGMHILQTVSKITSAKGNNVQIAKLKKYVDTLLNTMYKGIMKSGSNSSRLKLRKVLLLLIVLRAKQAFCKDANFES